MSSGEMTIEEKWVWCNQEYLGMILGIVKAVEERYGQEGREVAMKALYDSGRKVATKCANS